METAQDQFPFVRQDESLPSSNPSSSASTLSTHKPTSQSDFQYRAFRSKIEHTILDVRISYNSPGPYPLLIREEQHSGQKS